MERVRLEFPDAELRHQHPLTVRVTDMNYGCHLGHDAVISLLHEARAQALKALGLSEADMGGYPSVAADIAVQYQAEARFPDALVVDTAIPAPTGKVVTVFQRIRREADAKVVATARINLMLIDMQTGRPVAVPDEVRDRLSGSA
ncbi:acyl-CoA thioesterase [Halomonas halocynthiae]|uniref:acyl-CoA thioesterase n=1 Tax=Halomonas halocynthiae TaxID=176290 RepID=UPI0003FD47FB|nr:thioesterase family protein [Halomonas halocynthiae]